LPPIKGAEDQIFDLLDFMRNHLEDEIAKHALELMLL